MVASSTPLEAIILAGGLGSRLRTAVPSVPKVLAPVEGRPFLQHVIEQLSAQGIRNLCLAVGHKSDEVENYFGDGSRFGMTIRYSVESRALGTGGAIKLAAEILDGDFLVLNGDSYVDIDYALLLQFHRQKKAALSMVLIEQQDTSRYGTVQLDNAGQVVAFAEKCSKSPIGFINAGVYVMSNAVFSHAQNSEVMSLENDVFPSLIGSGFHGFVTTGYFVDIGIPSSYEAVKSRFVRSRGD